MANLGAIGNLVQELDVLYGGVISGVVLDSSMNPAIRLVRATHRKTGNPSGSAFSEGTYGTYAIYTNISYGKEQHTVTEYDDDAGDTHNARVFDRVIPL